MKIYVAAPWDERAVAADVAEKLEERGHEITHDWWNYDGGGDQSEEFLRLCALDDYLAVLNCEAFLLLNTQERGKETSGKAVETGIALRQRLLAGSPRIIMTGHRMTNLFHYMPEVEYYPTVEAAIAAIG